MCVLPKTWNIAREPLLNAIYLINIILYSTEARRRQRSNLATCFFWCQKKQFQKKQVPKEASPKEASPKEAILNAPTSLRPLPTTKRATVHVSGVLVAKPTMRIAASTLLLVLMLTTLQDATAHIQPICTPEDANDIVECQQQQQEQQHDEPLQQEQEQDDEEPECGLWSAESTLYQGLLGIFSGIDVNKGAQIGDGDLLVPIYDPNTNEWSTRMWQDIMWNGDITDDLFLQNFYRLQAFLPGIASNVICPETLGNLQSRQGMVLGGDTGGVHRSKDTTAGTLPTVMIFRIRPCNLWRPDKNSLPVATEI